MAQAALFLLIVAAPNVQVALVNGWGSGAWCGAGSGLAVWQVPVSFWIDVVFLVPSFIACVLTVLWLNRVAWSRPRQWRAHLASLGGAVSCLMFVVALGWTPVMGWFALQPCMNWGF